MTMVRNLRMFDSIQALSLRRDRLWNRCLSCCRSVRGDRSVRLQPDLEQSVYSSERGAYHCRARTFSAGFRVRISSERSPAPRAGSMAIRY